MAKTAAKTTASALRIIRLNGNYNGEIELTDEKGVKTRVAINSSYDYNSNDMKSAKKAQDLDPTLSTFLPQVAYNGLQVLANSLPEVEIEAAVKEFNDTISSALTKMASGSTTETPVE